MDVCLSESDLYRYHAGEMDAAERDRVRRHLDTCADCRQRESRLRAHHEKMIRSLRDMDPAPSRPAAPEAASTVTQHEQPETRLPPGGRIGPYLIREFIAEGGFGDVYRAEQTEPVRRRNVALKIIKLGMDSRQVLARFEAERQALALMDHPSVAKVFDAGTTEQGRPYFAMEYIAGVSITEHCDRHKLNVKERLGLFIQVCEAVQHAHQKGIIHRDIKPSNILVAPTPVETQKQPGGRGATGIPKVIDFGVSKALNQPLTEKTIFTERGQLIGTPEYMSPEQAEMTAQDIDTRSDIYSLGVLLYELLTGALPFDRRTLRGAALDEIVRIIREETPRKPSTRLSGLAAERHEEPPASAGAALQDGVIAPTRTAAQAEASGSDRGGPSGSSAALVADHRRTDARSLLKLLRGDLDWITMMCLEKDRTRRYETATALADDLRRHLNNQPVVASPPSIAYRTKKFIRRNRGAVTAAMVVFLVLVAGIAGTTWQAVVATHQRNRAVTAEREQSRARKQAEQARAAEETQRKLAEQRAKETEQVAEFQQSMLSGIDAEQMGRALFADLRSRVRDSLEAEKVPPEDMDSVLHTFNQSLHRANATDAALKLIDEQVLSRAVKAIENDFADQPLVQAALEHTVADTYEEIGLYESAMPLQKKALKTRRRVLGDDHLDTLESINNMGHLLQTMGKLKEAEPYVREAMRSTRRALGNDHPDTLGSIDTMGGLLRAMGKLDEAEPYFREALKGSRRVLGDDHPSTLTSIGNMGSLLHSMSKLKEAEPYVREALEGRRRVLGNDHPHTLISIASMGSLLQKMGKFEKAEPYCREAMEGRRRVLGDGHSDTLISIGNMGSLLYSMGKLKEAEPYVRETMRGTRRALGNDHPLTLTSIGNMGSLLYSMGKLKEAEPYCREALEGRRRVLGNDDPDTLTSIDNMGHLLDSMGKLKEAEPYYREAIEGKRRVLGGDDFDTLGSINNMGYLLNMLGRHEDAFEVLHAGEAAARRRLSGPNTRLLGAYLAKLGEAEGATGRFAQGEATLFEAHQLLAAGFGETHARTTKCITRLVQLYDAWHAAEPDKGYDAKATEWRAKLPSTTTQPTSKPTTRPATRPAP